MRWLQKIVRNGNSSQITLPRDLLGQLGWLPGEAVIVQLLEDKQILVRRSTPDDFAPRGLRAHVIDQPNLVKP